MVIEDVVIGVQVCFVRREYRVRDEELLVREENTF